MEIQARALQKKLDTTRTIHTTGNKIHISSAWVSELLSLDPSNGEITYALEKRRFGKPSLGDELSALWDKLEQLYKTGEIQEYIGNPDEVENPVAVFTYEDCDVVEYKTDCIGYPNVTLCGLMQYDNTHFATYDEAMEKLKIDLELRVKWRSEQIVELEQKLEEANKDYNNLLEKLKAALGESE